MKNIDEMRKTADADAWEFAHRTLESEAAHREEDIPPPYTCNLRSSGVYPYQCNACSAAACVGRVVNK
jgi:hypothetical protein